MTLSDIGSHPYSKLGLSNFDTNKDLARHRWFQFKEGFSAELVRLAVADLNARRPPAILDTFVGSGTSLVEAGRIGSMATGIEVNPFLSFASRAKTAPSTKPSTTYSCLIDELANSGPREIRSPLEGQSTFTEGGDSTKWLFNRSVLRSFAAIQSRIRAQPRLRRPLELALLAALLDCSNAKRDGKCLRYKRGWEDAKVSSTELRSRFRERAMLVIEDLQNPSFDHSKLKVITGDCRTSLANLPAAAYDLWVTSPPYLNSFDYSDVYRPELFAAGFVSTNDELRKIRKKTLCSHVQVKREYTEDICSALLKPILDRIAGRQLWNQHLPGMVRTYFADLALVCQKVHPLLRRGGKAWIVVSTSAYAGVEIPVDLILADLASKSGWKLCGIYVLRELRAAGQYWSRLEKGSRPPLRESLLVLER